jgi:hypothetical protein
MAFEYWKTTDGTQNYFYKNSIKTDASGNVYIAGGTKTSNGTMDILLSKKNSSGVTLWTQQYNGVADGNDLASAMCLDASGNIYLTGIVSDDVSNPLQTDVVIMMYDNNGTLQWKSSYDGGTSNLDAGKDIMIDESLNTVYVTGGSYNSSYNSDIVTLGFDMSGNQMWVNTYNYTAGMDDIGYNIVELNSSTLLVSGAVTSASNTYKFCNLKLDISNGSLIADGFGTAVTTSSIDVVSDVVIDATKHIYITGGYQVSGQGLNYYTMKLDSNLVTQWTQTYNGSSNLDDIAKNIKLDASNNVYVTGYVTSSTQGRNITTIKYNSSGTQQWLQTINGSANGNDEGASMIIDASSNLYIAGYQTTSLNQADYYVVKYNSSGTKIWEIQTDGNHLNDQATNIALDSLNNVIVSGQSEITAGNYQYLTTRYVQKDVITPTDFNGEAPKSNALYYENKGQLVSTTLTAVPDVKFYTKYTYPLHYIKNNSSSFVFNKINLDSIANDSLQRIDIDYDRSLTTKIYPLEKQDNGYLSYFTTNTTGSKITGVFGNQRLISPNIYANIDLMYSSNQNGIKYYYIVKPGGNPKDIQLTVSGATSFSLNGTTNALSINSSMGSLTFDRPTVYQLSSTNATVAVSGWTADWQTNGASNKYKFNTGAYTTSLTLIIEVDQGNSVSSAPSTIQNLNWSTFIGSSSQEQINKVKTDNNNNLFTLGQSYSANFPQGTGIVSVYQGGNLGSIDAFICKFSSIGELKWSTFVGGTNNDNLVDIAIHSNGDLYCVGNTGSSDLIYQKKMGASNDTSFAGPFLAPVAEIMQEGFIFQLKQDGLTNDWLRYYGGSDNDVLTACDMDVNNNFFITGYSLSTNIGVVHPTGTYTQANGGAWDGILARFNSSSSITWATYLGSSIQPTNGPSDYLNDIVLTDGLDGGPQDFYVTGFTLGLNYPNVTTTSSSNYTTTNSFSNDGVLTRFKNDGKIVWSTCFGGNNDDVGCSLAYGNHKLYVTGMTNSSDFLSINSGSNYFQSYGGNYDAVLMTVDTANIITHSTFLGGSDDDLGWDIIYNTQTGTTYISGDCTGSHFPIPVTNPVNTYNQSYAGNADNFICAFKDNYNSMLWGTYLGGTQDEFVVHIAAGQNHQSICVDNIHNLYLGGMTRSGQTQTIPFPLDNGGGAPTYFQPLMNGPIDATITRFDLTTVVVGIKENILSSNDILIYPNPTSHNLFIKLNSNVDKLDYKIVNTLGQIVASGKINSGTSSINTEKLSTGVYIIELINSTSKFSAKFIKND